MMRTHDTDVLIVGAGPVGLFTALLLAQKGIKCQIIDQQWRTAVHSYSCALHPHTLKLLDQLGLTAELVQRGIRIETIAFYEQATRMAELNLKTLPADFPFLLVLPQSEFEDLLERQLHRKHKLQVEWNHRFSRLRPNPDGTLSVQIDKLGETSQGYIIAHLERAVEKSTVTRAAFVLGADGHESVVRQTLAAGYEALGAPDLFEVYEFETDTPLENEVRIVLTHDTANALWPLPQQHARWTFQILPAGPADELWAKERLPVRFVDDTEDPRTLEHLRALIADRAPWFRPAPTNLLWSVAMHFDKRIARTFGRDRVWLVGDAAHQTIPIGMQSMNLGLLEAADLADKLARIIRENAPLDLLNTYGQQRRAAWEQLLGFKNGWRPTPNAPPWVQRYARRIIPCLPASGDELIALASNLGIAVS